MCGKPQKIRLDQYLRYEINCKFCIRGCMRGDILGGSVGLGLFGQGYLTLGSNPLGAIFGSFLNETRQKSASLEPVADTG